MSEEHDESHIIIPPEAIEAVAREDYAVRASIVASQHYTLPPWEELAAANRAVEFKHAERTLRVGLKAWPGMGPIRTDQPIGDWCDKLPAIILPLSQEKQNAEG